MTEFTRCGLYRFNFSDSGLFTLMDKNGEQLYLKTLPYFEKLLSHLAWIALWSLLIFFSHMICRPSWTQITDKLFMSLIFIHLFVFGARLTTLLIQGGLKPILFPPLWIKLTRKLQRGANMELLKKHNLDKHPGLLANLFLAQYNRNEFKEAQQTIQRALSLAPDHPVLLGFVRSLHRTNLID